jgi:Ca-activated chloride channel family protein
MTGPNRLALGLILASLCVLPVAAAEPGSMIQFVSPRHLSTAIGPTSIEIRLALPRDLSVEKLTISVNNEQLVTLTSPPWTALFDAGDGSRGNRLEATIFLSDGNRDRAVIRTSALRINQVEEVGMVNLYPVVRDRRGAYVTDLVEADFRIVEGGVPQTIKRFTTERRPLRIGIVLDTSLTMEEDRKLRNAKNAAMEFIDIMEPGDEGMVVAFSDDVNVLQEITSATKSMAVAIDSVSAGGGTALYDAVWRTSKKLEQFDGRRVLVLLSDGKDEDAGGFGPGSLHTLDEALNQALRSEVILFSIGLGRRLDKEFDREGRFTLKAILNRLAVETGGRALISPGAGGLRKAFEDVADDLRNQYSIAYISNDDKRNGQWRPIEVNTNGRELEVSCRKGYFASDDEATSGSR